MNLKATASLLSAVLGAAACSAGDEPVDAADAAFTTGKADSVGAGSAHARAILRLVNDAFERRPLLWRPAICRCWRFRDGLDEFSAWSFWPRP